VVDYTEAHSRINLITLQVLKELREKTAGYSCSIHTIPAEPMFYASARSNQGAFKKKLEAGKMLLSLRYMVTGAGNL